MLSQCVLFGSIIGCTALLTPIRLYALPETTTTAQPFPLLQQASGDDLEPPSWARAIVPLEESGEYDTLLLGEGDMVALDVENELPYPDKFFCALVHSSRRQVEHSFYVDPEMGMLEPNGSVEITVKPIDDEDNPVGSREGWWLVISTKSRKLWTAKLEIVESSVENDEELYDSSTDWIAEGIDEQLMAANDTLPTFLKTSRLPSIPALKTSRIPPIPELSETEPMKPLSPMKKQNTVIPLPEKVEPVKPPKQQAVIPLPEKHQTANDALPTFLKMSRMTSIPALKTSRIPSIPELSDLKPVRPLPPRKEKESVIPLPKNEHEAITLYGFQTLSLLLENDQPFPVSLSATVVQGLGQTMAFQVDPQTAELDANGGTIELIISPLPTIEGQYPNNSWLVVSFGPGPSWNCRLLHPPAWACTDVPWPGEEDEFLAMTANEILVFDLENDRPHTDSYFAAIVHETAEVAEPVFLVDPQMARVDGNGGSVELSLQLNDEGKGTRHGWWLVVSTESGLRYNCRLQVE